jgi:hypothetical protein
MKKELTLTPEIAFKAEALKAHIQHKLTLSPKDTFEIRILKRSIDARKPDIKVHLQVEVFINETPPNQLETEQNYQNVENAPQAIIIGAGPAGMFAALRLIELGIKPILLERGKDVRGRRRDLADINKKHIVNPESNYCFGEGGAGTYSDGKLYTRSKKRGDIRRVLEILVRHGAIEDILFEAHPHIGTNKLPQIVQALRESILEAGGEVHFNTKVTDFILQENEMKGVITEDGQKWEGIGVILATGHSARDIFHLLHKRKILIEFKPYALGVRIEHAQSSIDSIQYKTPERGEYLPPSAYSLVAQVKHKDKERGVFSFCMCPGGFIVPSATAPGELVVNGMSPSRRNSAFANSGMVVAVDWEDIKEFHDYGPLAGLMFQQAVEQKAFELAGQTQAVPAQKMLDFVQKRISKNLLKTSYQPGLVSMNMDKVLPDFIAHSLREGFKVFGKKMKGYLSNEAQIIGIESRTSSPVRIPRDKLTTEHPEVARFFPCGEGAGYAGGIMSAAMDGERCAEQLALKYAIS